MFNYEIRVLFYLIKNEGCRINEQFCVELPMNHYKLDIVLF